MTPQDRFFMSPDALGLYSVGGRGFFNKFEALEKVERGKGLGFHWNDAQWGALDWKTPPAATLAQLYHKRAEQLRHQYDYLLLSYSGGADSGNVLDTFDQHGIFLDEIASWHDYGLSGDRGSLNSADFFKVADFRAHQFVEEHPGTRYTPLDMKDTWLTVMVGQHADALIDQYLHACATASSPMRWGYWVYDLPHIRKLVDAGKKVCLLWGWDKTLIQSAPGHYSFSFGDMLTQVLRKKVYRPSAPIADEFFYWTLDLPELLIKQCHVLKAHLEALPSSYVDPYPFKEALKEKSHFALTKHRRKVSYETINTWLYGKTPGFSAGKPPGNYFHSLSEAWIDTHASADAAKNWCAAVAVVYGRYQKARVFNPLLRTRPYKF